MDIATGAADFIEHIAPTDELAEVMLGPPTTVMPSVRLTPPASSSEEARETRDHPA